MRNGGHSEGREEKDGQSVQIVEHKQSTKAKQSAQSIGKNSGETKMVGGACKEEVRNIDSVCILEFVKF